MFFMTQFDPLLIRRYDRPGPCYSTYPTTNWFDESYGEGAYRDDVRRSNAPPTRPLALHLLLPFCARLCFYCACNRVVTKDRARAAPYLARLHREIARKGELFDPARVVERLHWGGGTPLFLAHAQLDALMRALRAHFRLRDDDRGDYTIEVDPREVRPGTLPLLRELGFNRLSLGVQDLDPEVQRAVNRIHGEAVIARALDQARALGFRSINLDLMCGLPRQRPDAFAQTLARVIALAPAQVSLYHYAHLPQLFASQRRIAAAEVPSPSEKFDLLELAVERLTHAGYVRVGMDRFARAGSGERQDTGVVDSDGDLIGLGVGAVSRAGDSYAQNYKDLTAYSAAIDAGRLPIARGLVLSADDRLRADVITQLRSRLMLNVAATATRYGIDFWDYFARERAVLEPMARDGLVDVDHARMTVLPRGRLLARSICMVFDRYLAPSGAEDARSASGARGAAGEVLERGQVANR